MTAEDVTEGRPLAVQSFYALDEIINDSLIYLISLEGFHVSRQLQDSTCLVYS